MQTIALRKRHLEKTNGVYGLVRTSGPITNQSIMVNCRTQVAIPIIRSVAMVHQADASSKTQVTPCVVPLEDQSQELQLEVTNQGTEPVRLDHNDPLGEIHQVKLEPSADGLDDDIFLKQFSLHELPDDVTYDDLSQLSTLLIEQKSAFAASKLDLGYITMVEHQIELTDNKPLRIGHGVFHQPSTMKSANT